jgi:hypothetical protein
MEDTVRKLCLMLAASLAVLSTGAQPSDAGGFPPGAGTIYRGHLEEAYRPALEQVQFGWHRRSVCTHFWNGRWHYRQICFSAPRYRYHYGQQYQYPRYRYHYGQQYQY